MKTGLSLGIAILAAFSVVVQFDLMLANRTMPVFETTIRFFSYFTILTNSIVAFYFSRLTYLLVRGKSTFIINFGTLTAITVYITIVGLVYQVFLRHAWSPTGLQKIVDEILHSVNPILVIAFWLWSRRDNTLKYNDMGRWLIFPLLYLIYVLIRGNFSGFYPYPFLNISIIGLSRVIINCVGMTLLFILISALFIWISKRNNKVVLDDNSK